VGTQDATSIYEVKIAAPADPAGLRFIDLLLRADPDRAESVRLAVEQSRCLAAFDGDRVKECRSGCIENCLEIARKLHLTISDLQSAGGFRITVWA
jgi:hypothetical protein